MSAGVPAHEFFRTRTCQEPLCTKDATTDSGLCDEHDRIEAGKFGERTSPPAAPERVRVDRVADRSHDEKRERILEAIRDYAREHGRPPVSGRLPSGGVPSAATLKRYFGSFANAIEQAGFERPVRGGRQRRRAPLEEVRSGPRASAERTARSGPQLSELAGEVDRLLRRVVEGESELERDRRELGAALGEPELVLSEAWRYARIREEEEAAA